MLIKNIFELEKFIFFLKNPNEEQQKQFLYEFNNYIFLYENNKKYFEEVVFTIETKAFNIGVYKKEHQLISFFILFFDELQVKYNLIFNSKKLISQLIAIFLFLSFEIKITTTTNHLNSQWVWQHTIIETVVEYFINFQLFYNNGVLFKNADELIYKRWVFFIVRLLVKENFLIQKPTKKNKKTLIFLSLVIPITNFYNLKIFLNEPSMIYLNNNVYLYGQHYTSLRKVFNENKSSNDYFKLKDFDFLKKLKTLKYHINWNFYDTILKKLQQDFNCTEADLEEQIYLKYNENKNNNSDVNKLIIFLQFIQIKKQLFNKIDYFYLSYFFDFRGRIYSYSPISPMGSRIFRYLYFYGYYDNNELTNINSNLISDEVLKLLKSNKIVTFDYTYSWKIVWIYWSLFEVGKLFKKELLINNNIKLSDKDLITVGLQKIAIKNDLYFNELEDWIEFNYSLCLIDEVNTIKPKRLIVFKDATASGIQLLTLILGAKNKEILEKSNLFSQEYWYDTYSYIINNFLADYPTKSKVVQKYFTRKYLKKVIMTYNYSIGFEKAEIDFFDQLEKKDKKNKYIKKQFKLFFDYLKTIFEKGYFYKNPSKIIINTFKEYLKETKKLEIKLPDESTIYLQYHQLEKTRIDRIAYKHRNTIIFYTVGDEIDEYRTFVALRANLIHSLDATYIRFIINYLKYPIITIHDSLGIDILNIFNLIFIANQGINTIGYINELNFLNKELIIYNSKYILL